MARFRSLIGLHRDAWHDASSFIRRGSNYPPVDGAATRWGIVSLLRRVQNSSRTTAGRLAVFAIQVTVEEGQLLEELLNRAHRDLKEEIYKTEAREFKEGLRERKHLLEELIQKLTTSRRATVVETAAA